MGVSGLLTLLRSIQKTTSLKAYAGQTLGVDAFGWLHRAAIACAFQLALEKPTTQYVTSFMARVRMLQDFGVVPYLVFDGDAVPSKNGTNSSRRQERKAAKELGMELWRSGKKDAAQQQFQKAVSITPQMTQAVIRELRRMNIQFVIAPYEADAQLTYLEKEGIIDGILSEDSDLLVFGAKKLITKLDQYGACIEIDRSDFPFNKDISFAGWSDSMFRKMAIMSGCDYLDNINKMGLRTSHSYIKKYKDVSRVLRVMAFNGKHSIPHDYEQRFYEAENAFLYHRVFCPKKGAMVFLNEIPPNLKEEDMPYLGTYVEPNVALGVACGDLHPKTKQKFPEEENENTPRGRPVLAENRRQTIAVPSDLKSKNSIDNFFRPARRPLAELDPNSLTPSPSQQRLFQQHRNASWEPRMANSAPPLRRTVTDVYRDIAVDPTPSQERRATFLARASTLSTYIPIKRQRLCAEADDATTDLVGEETTSKFFSPGAEHSPLIRRTRKQKPRKAEFDIFSDDSVEGLLVNLERQVVESAEADRTKTPSPMTVMGISSAPEPELDSIPQSSPARPPPARPVAFSTSDSFIDSQSSHGTIELSRFNFDPQAQSAPTMDEVKYPEISAEDSPEEFVSLLDYHVTQLNQSQEHQKHLETFSNQPLDRQKAALATLPKPATLKIVDDVLDEPSDDSDEQLLPDLPDLLKTFVYQSPAKQLQALRGLSPPVDIVPQHDIVLQSPRTVRKVNAFTSTLLASGRGSEEALLAIASSECDPEEAHEPAAAPEELPEVDSFFSMKKLNFSAFKFRA